jgi:hypothetical protein
VEYKEALSPVEFERLLSSYETEPGKGLPIGSLTSQHWANFYLGALDRFVKERLGRPYCVRYMDDFAVWGDSAAELRAVQSQIEGFLHTELNRQPSRPPVLNAGGKCKTGPLDVSRTSESSKRLFVFPVQLFNLLTLQLLHLVAALPRCLRSY